VNENAGHLGGFDFEKSRDMGKTMIDKL